MNRKYRRPLIAGNWKMNKTPAETKAFLTSFKAMLPGNRSCDVALCVPAVCIPAAVKVTRERRILIGAQACSACADGGVTGEVSAAMLAETGCRYVLAGHSERRARGETDAEINAALKTILSSGMRPILCCGEGPKQRELNVTQAYLTLQLCTALEGIGPEQIREVVVAYEPIGAAHTTTPEQAQAVCAQMRAVLRRLYGAKLARGMVLLYGGGMTEGNAAAFLAQPDIDGGLVGEASLEPERFLAIVTAAQMAAS